LVLGFVSLVVVVVFGCCACCVLLSSLPRYRRSLALFTLLAFVLDFLGLNHSHINQQSSTRAPTSTVVPVFSEQVPVLLVQ
jgi:hypothetical protein